MKVTRSATAPEAMVAVEMANCMGQCGQTYGTSQNLSWKMKEKVRTTYWKSHVLYLSCMQFSTNSVTANILWIPRFYMNNASNLGDVAHGKLNGAQEGVVGVIPSGVGGVAVCEGPAKEEVAARPKRGVLRYVNKVSSRFTSRSAEGVTAHHDVLQGHRLGRLGAHAADGDEGKAHLHEEHLRVVGVIKPEGDYCKTTVQVMVGCEPHQVARGEHEGGVHIAYPVVGLCLNQIGHCVDKGWCGSVRAGECRHGVPCKISKIFRRDPRGPRGYLLRFIESRAVTAIGSVVC